jgi:hypothetical protein
MPANEKVPSPGKERTESSDKPADKKNRRLLKAIVSVVTAAVTAVVCDYFVQGSHSLAAPAVCGVKYLTAPPGSYPDSSHWVAYGVSNLTTTSSRSFSLQPGGQLLTDEWFGATLAGPDLCDYRVAFDADITGPLHPAAVRILGSHVVHLDGAGSGGILFRIWNARLDVRDVKISKLRP